MQGPVFLGSLAVVAGAIYLIVRRTEVRLVLLGAGLLLALLGGRPLALFDAFARGMIAPMVAPICAAMGFAAAIHATSCDRHLVHLLLRPIRRRPWLALPGGILAAYVVNAAIPSQTSTAAALGPILVPLLLAAGVSPEVAGAALLLGASFGGDLLSPGAQDVQAVAGTAGLPAAALSARVVPASLTGMGVAALVFTLLQRRAAAGTSKSENQAPPVLTAVPEEVEGFRVQPLKALLPLFPVLLLLAAAAGLPGLAWLQEVPQGESWKAVASVLPVVRAMLLGTLLALLAGWRELAPTLDRFFTGMGQAYAGIISLTIAAQCFGAGLAAVGLSEAIVAAVGTDGRLARGLAVAFPWGLATLSGSGSGPVLAFAQTILVPLGPEAQPVGLGALACLAGAFGRTMSPVAAVVVYTSALVGLSPVVLIRRLLPALLAGATVSLAMVLLAQ